VGASRTLELDAVEQTREVFSTPSSFLDADPVIDSTPDASVTMKRGQQTDEANNLGAPSGLSIYG
jgi:hypothetical protein